MVWSPSDAAYTAAASPAGSGAEDHDVAGRAGGPDRHPEFFDHLGVARVDQDVPGVEEHHGQPGAVFTGLREGFTPSLALGFVKPVGNRGSGQQVPHLVQPGDCRPADNSDSNVMCVLRGVPRGEEVADPRIEDPLEREPGIEQVVVDLPEGHHRYDRMAGRIVAALDQQDPLGLRLEPMYAKQEIGRCGVPQSLIDDHERGGGIDRDLIVQPVQCGIGRRRRGDRIVRTESVGYVVNEVLLDRLITRHNQNQRWSAAGHALILCTLGSEISARRWRRS